MLKIKNYPSKINDEQLRSELLASGIKISQVTPYIDGDKNLVIDIVEGSVDAVDAIVAAHKAVEKAEPTVIEKLARAGIGLDELKAALGL